MSGALNYPVHDLTSNPIPWQLQRNDLLFVMLPRGEKGLQTKGWNLVSNGRRWDNLVLLNHLDSGGNYGMYPAPGSSLLFIDVDNADVYHQAGGANIVENTYRYSAWPDRRKYRAVVECPDQPDHFKGHKVSFKNKSMDTIFELFFPANENKAGGQCVGPGSLHPNGNIYLPFDADAPILEISWEEIQQVSSIVNPEFLQETIPEINQSHKPSTSGKSLSDRYSLSVMTYLPTDAYLCGSEIRGKHPIHGSCSKAGNVSINPTKGTFYCFRCERGGDAAIWDAINRGIIQCDEPYDDAAFKKHLEILNEEKPEVRFFEKLAWKKARGKR